MDSDEQNDRNTPRSADNEFEVDQTVIIDNDKFHSIVQETNANLNKRKMLLKSETEGVNQEQQQPQVVNKSVGQVSVPNASTNQGNSGTNQMKQADANSQIQKIEGDQTTILVEATGKDTPQSEYQSPKGVQVEANPQQNDKNEEIEDTEESDEDQDKVMSEFVETSPSGRFKRFDEELGRGAYKTVYRGVDHDTGREVAWSIICLARLPKTERPRIKSEIKIIKELNHPNIITFISAWICKEKEQIHFITEIITGGSLRQYLKKMGKPKLKVIKKWCHEILQGIAYLHEQQAPIIHRDIKCDNIFINSNSGEIKIGDLGLSTTMKNSYTSSVLGTPEFMAPELYEEYYGTEVDIYAFGMALLEMLTREAPYRECQNPAQIYRKVINRELPFSLERIKNEQVRNFITCCLDERTKRPTARQLLESEFMKDMSSEINNHYVEIADARIKIPKKKKVIKNNLPDIEEDPINEDMEIKAQNSRIPESTAAQGTHANLQALAKEEVVPSQQEPAEIATTGASEKKKEEATVICETPTVTAEFEKETQTEGTKIQRQKSKNEEEGEKDMGKEIARVEIKPDDTAMANLHKDQEEQKSKSEEEKKNEAQKSLADEKSPQQNESKQNQDESPGNKIQESTDLGTDKSTFKKKSSSKKMKRSWSRAMSAKYSNESDSDVQEKLNQTIIYLNNLDDEKANRLQLDESRIPAFYESQEDEYEYEMRVGFDMKISKATLNQEAVHFVDPTQIAFNVPEKQNTLAEPPKINPKQSVEGKKPSNQVQNVKLSSATEAPQTEKKAKHDKNPKPQEPSVLQQLQEDLAREEERKRKEKKKEEEKEELKRQKQLFKESIMGNKSAKPMVPTKDPIPVTNAAANAQTAQQTQPAPSRQNQKVVSKQPQNDTTPQKTVQPQQPSSQPTHDSQTKQPMVAKKLKKEDLDKETSKIKKFKEDQEEENHEIQQQLAAASRATHAKKLQRQVHQEVLTPSKYEDSAQQKQSQSNAPPNVLPKQVPASQPDSLTAIQPPQPKPLQPTGIATATERDQTPAAQAQSTKRKKEVQTVAQQPNPMPKSKERLKDPSVLAQNQEAQIKKIADKPQVSDSSTANQPAAQTTTAKASSGKTAKPQVLQDQKTPEIAKDQQKQHQTTKTSSKPPETTAAAQSAQNADKKPIKRMQTGEMLQQVDQAEKANEQQMQNMAPKAKVDAGVSLDWNIVNQQQRNQQEIKQIQPVQQPLLQQPSNANASQEISRTQVKKQHATPQTPQILSQSKQTVLQLAQQEQAPEKIPMDIQIQNNKIVHFEYMLKSDTPDQILNELIQQNKLDPNYYQTFLDQANEILQLYENARRQYLSMLTKAKSVEETKVESVAHTVPVSKKPHVDTQPQQSILQKTVAKQTQSTAQQALQSTIPQQKPVSRPANYHTEEFIKRRDEFKKVYKTMNNGIREFFQLMITNNLDVDQVLDIMDYVEDGDRNYKKNFIQSLQQVHTQFLAKKSNTTTAKKTSTTHTSTQQIGLQSSKKMEPQASTSLPTTTTDKPSEKVIEKATEKAAEKPTQITQSQQQASVSKKPSGGKKERDSSQKPIKQVIINHLRQKRLRLQKSAVQTQEKSHQKMVAELQALINQVNGAMKISREVEILVNTPKGEIQDSLNQVMEISRDVSHEIKVDGQFGDTTEEEVIKLQERLNIEKDGTVTELMVCKLEGLLNKLNFINQIKIDKLREQLKHPIEQNQALHATPKVSSAHCLLEGGHKPHEGLGNSLSQKVTKEEDKEESISLFASAESLLPNKPQQSAAAINSLNQIESPATNSPSLNLHPSNQTTQQDQASGMKNIGSQSSTKASSQQHSNQGNQAPKTNQIHQSAPKNRIEPITEAEMALEEQGSSSGTNPLHRLIFEAPQEEGYDADETFMTMGSKEQENNQDEQAQSLNQPQDSFTLAKK